MNSEEALPKEVPRLGAAVRARQKAVALSQETLADAAEVDRSHNCLRFISQTILSGHPPPGANVSFGSRLCENKFLERFGHGGIR